MAGDYGGTHITPGEVRRRGRGWRPDFGTNAGYGASLVLLDIKHASLSGSSNQERALGVHGNCFRLNFTAKHLDTLLTSPRKILALRTKLHEYKPDEKHDPDNMTQRNRESCYSNA